MKPSTVISVIIPAHNESQGIEVAVKQIAEILTECVDNAWEIIVVDDGSSDDTYQKVCTLSQVDARIKGIALSRNFGKENALLAGLDYATGAAVITLDADLQHPPSFIPEMLDKWRAGQKLFMRLNAVAQKIQRGKNLPRTALITSFQVWGVSTSRTRRILNYWTEKSWTFLLINYPKNSGFFAV